MLGYWEGAGEEAFKEKKREHDGMGVQGKTGRSNGVLDGRTK